MTVEEKVRKVIADTLGIKEEKITPESIIDDLGADSLDRIEVVMALEKEFGIEISDEEVQTGNPVSKAIMASDNTSQGLTVVREIIKFINIKTNS